jgi:hypothetical protein
MSSDRSVVARHARVESKVATAICTSEGSRGVMVCACEYVAEIRQKTIIVNHFVFLWLVVLIPVGLLDIRFLIKQKYEK